MPQGTGGGIQVDKEKRGARETPLGQAESNLKSRTGVCAGDTCSTPRPDSGQGFVPRSMESWGRGGVESRGLPHNKH